MELKCQNFVLLILGHEETIKKLASLGADPYAIKNDVARLCGKFHGRFFMNIGPLYCSLSYVDGNKSASSIEVLQRFWQLYYI